MMHYLNAACKYPDTTVDTGRQVVSMFSIEINVFPPVPHICIGELEQYWFR